MEQGYAASQFGANTPSVLTSVVLSNNNLVGTLPPLDGIAPVTYVGVGSSGYGAGGVSLDSSAGASGGGGGSGADGGGSVTYGLTYLDMSSNAGLGGAIPAGLVSALLLAMPYVSLSGCSFSGGLPYDLYPLALAGALSLLPQLGPTPLLGFSVPVASELELARLLSSTITASLVSTIVLRTHIDLAALSAALTATGAVQIFLMHRLLDNFSCDAFTLSAQQRRTSSRPRRRRCRRRLRHRRRRRPHLLLRPLLRLLLPLHQSL